MGDKVLCSPYVDILREIKFFVLPSPDINRIVFSHVDIFREIKFFFQGDSRVYENEVGHIKFIPKKYFCHLLSRSRRNSAAKK